MGAGTVGRGYYRNYYKGHMNKSKGEGGEGGKVQRISNIDDRWKIDRGRVRIVSEM